MVSHYITRDATLRVNHHCTAGGKTSTKGAPSGLFPDNFVHLGGDEVNTGCWSSTPKVAAWLKQHGMSADDG